MPLKLTQKSKGKPKVTVRLKPKAQAVGSPPPLNIAGGDLLSKYRKALERPFDGGAVGAQVPDLYTFPTETAHIESSLTISSDASGNLSFIVAPSPTFTVTAFSGTGVSGSPTGAQAWGYLSSAGTNTPISGASSYGIAAATAISTRFSDYRIVGMGVRVKPLVSYTNAPGKFVWSTTPSMSHLQPFLVLQNGAAVPTAANVAQTLGAPWDAAALQIATSLITHPLHGQAALTELVQRGNMESAMRHSGPTAFDFRNVNSAYTGGYIVAGDNASVSGFSYGLGSSTSPIDANASETGGWSQLTVRGSGLPASTAVFELQIVMHIEGTPSVGAATGLAGATSKVAVRPLGFMQVLAEVANSPAFRMVASEGANLAANYGMRALTLMGGML